MSRRDLYQLESDAPFEPLPGLVAPLKTYALRPGMAVVYNEDSLHSPDRAGPTRLIRIEGRNLAGVKRDRYEPARSDAAAAAMTGSAS